jgi:hypothetical protein
MIRKDTPVYSIRLASARLRVWSVLLSKAKRRGRLSIKTGGKICTVRMRNPWDKCHPLFFTGAQVRVGILYKVDGWMYRWISFIPTPRRNDMQATTNIFTSCALCPSLNELKSLAQVVVTEYVYSESRKQIPLWRDVSFLGPYPNHTNSYWVYSTYNPCLVPRDSIVRDSIGHYSIIPISYQLYQYSSA